MEKLSTVDWVALVLVLVGALNWGLIGLMDLNLVTAIFGEDGVLTNIVYILVGVSALYIAFTSTKLGRRGA
jgi:uncharacterized protein